MTFYPVISNYVNEKYASEIHTAYEEVVQQADNTALVEAKELAIAYNEAITPGAAEEAYSQAALLEASVDYESQLNIADNGIMGYVEIPKINVNLPIYHGTGNDSLERGVGHLLGLDSINSIFLGGMLSMSSTTIIIKAFTDLNMRQRRFVPHVLAVLICEDLFAVVMMVLLSSVALNNSVEGSEMLFSIGKLVFFLVICFTVGVYVLPSFFNRFRRIINDEMLLIISVGLCMLMAVFSVYSGFSMALGAFIMGSILAGTSEAEHIEKVMKPVKDLFGAVFFISVGMMVNPTIIMEYWNIILLLSVVVVVGMILFGTFGMLATGQSLRIAMESGFSLTQIGEFAFIIASLGMSLNVLEGSLYPIVVAVSVITTFFTPYFIKWAIPCYEWIEKRMPKRVANALQTYSNNAVTDEATTSVWKTILGRYSWRILLYSVLIIAMMWISMNMC